MANTEQFIEGIATQAKDALARGDVALLNRLSGNPAIREYLNNVVFRQALTQESFKIDLNFRQYWVEIERLAHEYDLALREKARVDAMEEKLDRLAALLEQLVQVQTPKQKKALAVIEQDGEENQADDDAEKEPETPADDTTSEAADETDTTEDDE